MKPNSTSGGPMHDGNGLLIIAGQPDDAAQAKDSCSTDCVPLDALAMPDDQEQMTPPAVGDEVNYSVTGKVTAINGANAIIERKTINGQPVDEKEDDSQPDDEADLQTEAQQMDGGGSGGNTGGATMALILLLLSLALNSFGQSASLGGDGTAVSNRVVSATAIKLYQASGFNTNASTLFIHILQTNAAPANGAIPIFIVPAPPQTVWKIDFGAQGVDLDSCAIAYSSTTNSLTTSPTACGSITAIFHR
jgi:hypothetical protein